ncbi:GNAT family N-acetyltransferase [Paenibacillus septentrionalis]|uniref:GNAT family N-acetyltransferase n=1 Tax=Paenibacillus septentrionalis TaxID=429342 RepID=A0ABW1VAN0_9BACL
MKWSIKHFNELTNLEVYQMIKLRTDVFVVEQESIYSDCDNKDLDAYHVQLRDEQDQLVGYCRLLNQGVSYEGYSIGRVIIAPSLRGTGYGDQLVMRAVSFIKEHWNGKVITISAQHRLQKFYEKAGFQAESEPYLEDGIPHIQMSLHIL